MVSKVLNEPVLTVQVDVDSLQHLLNYYGLGQGGAEGDNPVYRLALPRFSQLFEQAGVKAAFFVVGQDLERQAHREIVRQFQRHDSSRQAPQIFCTGGDGSNFLQVLEGAYFEPHLVLQGIALAATTPCRQV